MSNPSLKNTRVKQVMPSCIDSAAPANTECPSYLVRDSLRDFKSSPFCFDHIQMLFYPLPREHRLRRALGNTRTAGFNTDMLIAFCCRMKPGATEAIARARADWSTACTPPGLKTSKERTMETNTSREGGLILPLLRALVALPGLFLKDPAIFQVQKLQGKLFMKLSLTD